jgi:hypothetical protein
MGSILMLFLDISSEQVCLIMDIAGEQFLAPGVS